MPAPMSYFAAYRAARQNKTTPRPPSRPKRLRVGAVIEMDRGVFLLRRKGRVTHPGSALRVDKIGTWTTADRTVYAHYLTGVGAETVTALLLAYVATNGEVDYAYFTPLLDVRPSSVEEWDVWLNEGEGLLGMPDILTPPDDVRYVRAVQPDRNEWIRPESYTEHRVSATGSSICVHKSMLFVRVLGQDPALDLVREAHSTLQKALALSDHPGIRESFAPLDAIVRGSQEDDHVEEIVLADFESPEAGDPIIRTWVGFELDPNTFVVN